METAVIIQKDIEDLNMLDQYINLSSYFHLNRSECDDCDNCNFLLNLRYIYLEVLVNQNGDGVEKLRNYCRHFFGNFFSLRTFLRSLAAIEREKVKLEKNLKNP